MVKCVEFMLRLKKEDFEATEHVGIQTEFECTCWHRYSFVLMSTVRTITVANIVHVMIANIEN